MVLIVPYIILLVMPSISISTIEVHKALLCHLLRMLLHVWTHIQCEYTPGCSYSLVKDLLCNLYAQITLLGNLDAKLD